MDEILNRHKPRPVDIGITTEEAVINMQVVLGGCPHREPVPVESIVTGEVVAALCVECDAQLPAKWAGG